MNIGDVYWGLEDLSKIMLDSVRLAPKMLQLIAKRARGGTLAKAAKNLLFLLALRRRVNWRSNGQMHGQEYVLFVFAPPADRLMMSFAICVF